MLFESWNHRHTGSYYEIFNSCRNCILNGVDPGKSCKFVPLCKNTVTVKPLIAFFSIRGRRQLARCACMQTQYL